MPSPDLCSCLQPRPELHANELEPIRRRCPSRRQLQLTLTVPPGAQGGHRSRETGSRAEDIARPLYGCARRRRRHQAFVPLVTAVVASVFAFRG